MAILYVDYEGGNDANDGSSFALRVKTLTSGATAARIAPGDTVRIMGSPAPTSLGINGTWTDGPLPATIAFGSSTNATPIVVTKASHGLTTGDTVVCTGHATNTNANGTWEVNVLTSSTFELTGSVGNGVGGSTGTFRKVNNCRVMLASAVTKTIQDCGFQSGAWTASANVTATISTSDFKEGYGSSSIAIASGFTTGLAAYKALGASTDFSAYKQISFWVKQTSGTLGAAGAVTLSLCSDTVGATPVNTVNVPAPTALNQWFPVTVDTGAALGAAIQSVGFNVVTDNAAQTFLIDNIIACKDSTSADSLTLTSLIGKNTGTETWCGIQSINDTRVMLDQGVNTLPSTSTYRGYTGTTETVTAYKRETIKTALASATTTEVQTITDSGSAAGGMIAYEGGWDRTAMTTQNLETWFDGLNGFGHAIASSNKTYVSLNKINFVRYSRALAVTGAAHWSIDNIHANNCSSSAASGTLLVGGYDISFGSIYSVSYNTNGTAGLWFSIGGANMTIANIYAANGNAGQVTVQFGTLSGVATKIFVTGSASIQNNSGTGMSFSPANGCVIHAPTIKDNTGDIIDFTSSSDNIIYDLVSSGNGAGVSADRGAVKNVLINASIAEATEVNQTVGEGTYIFSQKHDTTTDNHQIFTDIGRIASETSVRHTASGIAWRMSPTNANAVSGYPLILSIAKVACVASALVTVKAWMRRSNTGLTMKLMCKGGQISGVSSDQTASVSAVADTWEELTITFTPSEAGVVEITAEAYGGTTYNGYVDDLTITQA